MNHRRASAPPAPPRLATAIGFFIAFASFVLGSLSMAIAADDPHVTFAQQTQRKPRGIEIGPDTLAPRPPRPPAAARPPAIPAPPATSDVDSIRERIAEERERLERQEERLRELEDQLSRDRVILPRDGGDPGDDLPAGGDGALVRMGQDVEVREGEVVREVVVMGGDLVVRGLVEGDAVAIGGDLTVESGARVEGSAVTIGGRLDIDPAGIVEGDQVEVGGPFGAGFANLPWRERGGEPRGFERGRDVVRGFVVLLAFLLIGWVAVLLLGDPMSRMADMLEASFGRSILVGLLVIVLWLPAIILTCITVIGIPVGIFLLFAVPLAGFVGFFVGAMYLGRRIAAGLAFEKNSVLAHLLIGITAIGALLLLGKAVGLIGVLSPLATALCIVGFSLVVLAGLAGLGAVTVTLFENRRFRRRAGGTPPAGGGPTGPAGAGGPGEAGPPQWTPPPSGESSGQFITG